MEADVLALRITVGLHQGALIRLDTADLLVIGSSDDCDVILADAGVASHHCVLKKQGDKFFLRTIEGASGVGDRAQDPGATVFVPLGTPVTVGSAVLEIVNTAAVTESPAEVAQTLRASLPRHSPAAVAIAAGALIVTVFAVRAISLGISAHAAQEVSGHNVPVALTTSRSGASIARDVAEVLRLSGINCEAQYSGDGTVTVSGHLGDPQSLSAIVGSRAIREIVGLKRVMAVNLDRPGKAAGLAVDGTRIVSVVASADPYVVTADGSRYYVGAFLPQGGKLAGVKEGEVLVERDGHTEHWKLAQPARADGEFRPTGNLR
jgi:Inner membrane component of T3SS, cytoplasmic domain